MATDLQPAPVPLPVLNDCWNRIGVKGDRTCPELAVVVHCHNCPVFAAAGQSLFDREPPAECLEEWTRELARFEAAVPGETVPVVLFRLGAEWLALDVHQLIEIAEPRCIHRIPGRSNRVLQGLVNIRGELHLCISLRDLLAIEAVPPATTPDGTGRTRPAERLLLAERDQQRWVFAVDEVAGVERLELSRLRNVPATVVNSLAHFSRGVFPWKGRGVGYLQETRLFEALKGSIQ